MTWNPGKDVPLESELRHTLEASSLVPSAASNAYRPCKKPTPRTDNSWRSHEYLGRSILYLHTNRKEDSRFPQHP